MKCIVCGAELPEKPKGRDTCLPPKLCAKIKCAAWLLYLHTYKAEVMRAAIEEYKKTNV